MSYWKEVDARRQAQRDFERRGRPDRDMNDRYGRDDQRAYAEEFERARREEDRRQEERQRRKQELIDIGESLKLAADNAESDRNTIEQLRAALKMVPE